MFGLVCSKKKVISKKLIFWQFIIILQMILDQYSAMLGQCSNFRDFKVI